MPELGGVLGLCSMLAPEFRGGTTVASKKRNNYQVLSSSIESISKRGIDNVIKQGQ
jgi:hypothetical protein